MRSLPIINFLACVMFVHGQSWYSSKEVCEDTARWDCIEGAGSRDCIYFPQACKKMCGICKGDESDACVDTYTHCHYDIACKRYGNACRKTSGFCRDSQILDPDCADELSG